MIMLADCIRNIRDPEKPASLEDLQVVYEDGVQVTKSKLLSVPNSMIVFFI